MSQSDMTNNNAMYERKATVDQPKQPVDSPSPKNLKDEGLTKSFSALDATNMDGIDVPPEDEKIARDFLNRFLLNDEASAYSQINLIFFFKSVPHPIKGENLRRVKYFNFKLFQESLVAYKNIEDVAAFEYHDEKNRDRVSLVREQLLEQRRNLLLVNDALTALESTIDDGAKKMGKVFDDDEQQREEQQKLTKGVTNF